MKTRIITSVVALCFLVPVLIFSDTFIFPLALALCTFIAIYEMLNCIGLSKSIVISVPFYLCGIAFPFLIRYLKGQRGTVKDIAFAALIVSLLYFFTVLIFSHGKYQAQQLGVAYFTIVYIIFGFSGIEVIRDWVHGGEYLYFIAFVGAWVTDIFAYFCGMLLGRGGKHKLIPDVSPKKTVEGSVGGIVFCILSMLLFGWIVQTVQPEFQANYLIFAVAGLFVSIVAQIGDLSLSVIKRTYGIKDYGIIFPGHGGMLDRFDSVLAVSVILTVFTAFFDFFERI